ncbi:MAG TPA: hypothetical protein VF884_02965 [Nitrososphaeraceae archaeon]
MNLISSVFLGLSLLLVFGVVYATFDHKYDIARPIFQQSFEGRPINISDLKILKGNIVSLQYNGSESPAWILSGRWKLVVLDNNNTNYVKPDIRFTSNITMTNLDGTDSHKHKLTDFKLLNIEFKNRTAIINGTISLVTIGEESQSSNLGQSISGVPISIKIMNIRTIGIYIDKDMVKHHFGESQIYGTVAE